jgi:hypothetical protein
MNTDFFGNGINLGDERLNQRARKLLELITIDPSLSFPDGR